VNLAFFLLKRVHFHLASQSGKISNETGRLKMIERFSLTILLVNFDGGLISRACFRTLMKVKEGYIVIRGGLVFCSDLSTFISFISAKCIGRNNAFLHPYS